MQRSRTRLVWAFAVVVGGVGLLAWPLAAGAGAALTVVAILAGLQAAALALLLMALALAAAGLRVDRGSRSAPARRRLGEGQA